jgi:hypothetical protein
MAVKVFISSTAVDLEEDCRPFVRSAVTGCKADEVCMESWVTDFIEAEQVCRLKLAGSSHYLGVFAHWRGSSPSGQERSYTEAEFDWACELNKTKAIFMPKAATPYDRKLRRRAKAQDARAAEAQKNFRNRVRTIATAMDFDGLPQLVEKTIQVVDAWLGKGIVSEGRQAGAAASARTPNESDLVTLGRRELVAQFERAFDIIGGEGLAEVVGFLVHGPVGYGHAQAVRRLREAFEDANDDAQPRRVVLPIGGYWDGDDLSGMLSAFGRAVDELWEPSDVSALAARVKKLLATEHVILEINDLQRYTGGLASFVEQFWKPLTDALGAQAHQHKLVAFMSYEGAPEHAWGACTFDTEEDDEADFELSRPVKLPALEAFTEKELTAWLRGWLKEIGTRGGDTARQLEQARKLAATIYAETGGKPQDVYTKLCALVVN